MAVLAVLVTAVGGPAASAATVTTGAGWTELAFDGATGRLSSVIVGAVKAAEPTALPQSGFSLRDHATKDGFVPLAGPVIATKDGLEFHATAPDLRFEAHVRPLGTAWEITGALQRTSPQQRFLSLRFGVPITAAGWKWLCGPCRS